MWLVLDCSLCPRQLARKKAFEEQKVPRGGKCGVLPCVLEFSKFADRAEGIVMATDRRVDLDKAYMTLIESVFRAIERAAMEHPKTPPDVIKFGKLNQLLSSCPTHSYVLSPDREL